MADHPFLDRPFLQQIVATLFGTLVGAYLAFVAGLRLYRHQLRVQSQAQDAELSARQTKLLGILSDGPLGPKLC